MTSTLILTSTGLSDERVREAVRARADFSRHKKVALITTAAPEKEKSSYVQSDYQILKDIGFSDIDFFDVEKKSSPYSNALENIGIRRRENNVSGLRNYGVVYVAGGNTFYLLHHLRKSGADAVLREMLEKRAILYIGVSAGSIIMGKSIASSADENTVGLQDLAGLGLLDAVIIPHFGDHKHAIRDRMTAQGYRVVCLKDGEALVIEHGREIFV